MFKAAVSSFLLASTLAGAAGAQELSSVRLTVIGSASFMPLYADAEQPFWTEQLSENSNGQITAEVRPYNEAGLNGTELLRLVQQGVADASTPILGYLAADDPMSEAVDLAGISPTVEMAREISEAWQPILDKHYQENNGAVVLGILSYPKQVLYCKDSISSLSDLKGRKVRTANRTLAEFVEAVGASSVTMPIGDVIPSLERGVVDCAVTATLAGYKQKWYEVTNYVYDLGLGWSQLATLLDKGKWDSLSDADREFLQAQYDEFENAVWEDVAYESAKGMDCLTGQAECPFGEPASMTLVGATEEDEALRAEILQNTIVPKWLERCGESCAAPWNESIGKIVGVSAD